MCEGVPLMRENLDEAIIISIHSHQFINARLDPFTFIQCTRLFRSPDVISLNVINLFRQIHPLVLGFGHTLLLMKVANQT